MAGDPRIQRVETRLASLKTRYRGKLRERLQELIGAIDAIESPGGAGVENARVLAHRLRGTAGTYGFDEASALSAEVEATLRIGGDFELARAALIELAAELDGDPSETSQKAPPSVRSPVSLLAYTTNAEESRRIDDLCHALKVRIRHVRSPAEAMEDARDEPPDGLVVGTDGDIESAAKTARQVKVFAGRLLPTLFIGDAPIDRRSSMSTRAAVAPIDSSRAAIRSLIERVNRPVVVIIDDDPDFAAVAAEMLHAHGYRTQYEPDVTRALATIREANPAAVLLDVAMRSLSGLDVCRAIRASTNSRVPVLFCTALVDPQIQIDCFRAGGDGWMAKPLRSDLLRVRIDGLVRRSRHGGFGVLPKESFILRGELALQSRHPPNVLLLEIDGLHHVLRRDGFEAVDIVLDGATRLVATYLRGDDVIGRLDTSSFVVLAKGELQPIVSRLQELASSDLGDVSLAIGAARRGDANESLAELVADCRDQIRAR